MFKMKDESESTHPKAGCLVLFPRMLLGLVAVVLLAWNLRFYARPTVTTDHISVPPYAAAQLRWLRGELENGAGDRMQTLFPEGWFFCYLLYGLSSVELALRDSGFQQQGLENARWALAHIESDKGKAPFPPDLPPDHGMFYSAWRNHLLSGILLIQSAGERDPHEWALFEKRCTELADTFRKSSSPFPPSYRGQSWPCDAPPAIHSLTVHDAMTGEGTYRALIQDWIRSAKANVDPQTGLLPHTAELRTGEPLSDARATSQTIILSFLADVDAEWATDQYQKYRENFYVTRLGVPAIREYPRGEEKPGDVDSGPLILGVSGSATVVGMGVAGIYGDHEFARAVSQAGEAFGFPIGKTERRYLGGLLPIGDAFLLHATTARPWLAESEANIEPYEVSHFWRSGIQLISLGFWLLCWAGCKVFGRIVGRFFGPRENLPNKP